MLIRYYHTVAPLKLKQLVWRIIYKIRPATRPILQAARFVEPTNKYEKSITRNSSLIGSNTLFIMGEKIVVNQDFDWSVPSLPALIAYNVNYFDDVNAEGFEDRSSSYLSLVEHWLDNSKYTSLSWNAYPISIRIVNWLKCRLYGFELPYGTIDSIATQAEFLMRNLELHILGNHLLENAKALIFAGVCLDSPNSAKWLKKGVVILNDELNEQVLKGGAHFELSPMYQSVMLELVLDVINLNNAYGGILDKQIVKMLNVKASEMLNWLEFMTHPDEGISFFNDSALGVYATIKDLYVYCNKLRINTNIENTEEASRYCESSGYFRSNISGATLIADFAKVGPDYIPGHAHADTFSFELSVDKQRIFVNSGTSCYGKCEERQRQRSTKSHNTVAVNRRNSSDVWGGFRVGKRASLGKPIIKITKGSASIESFHTGYASERVIHNRRIELNQKKITIVDYLDGVFNDAKAYFYLHPTVVVTNDSDGVKLVWEGGAGTVQVEGGRVNVVNSTYHPEFNVTMASCCLEVEFQQSRVEFKFLWEDK